MGFPSLDEIPGLSFKRDKQPVISNLAPSIDLRDRPFPAYDLLPIVQYIEASDRYMPFRSLGVITSRGCPFDCAFCAVHQTMGRKWRAYSPSRIVDWLAGLLTDYFIDRIWFKDSTFTLNSKWIIDFCRQIKERGLKFSWVISTRVDTVDRKLADPQRIYRVSQTGYNDRCLLHGWSARGDSG